MIFNLCFIKAQMLLLTILCLFVFFFEKNDSKGLLREVFSRTSVTAFMSLVLTADDIATESGMPFYPLRYPFSLGLD
jgi:hypothetical protein